MMIIKKKRTIRLKDPRLRKIRTELRTLLRLVWQDQVRDLYNQIDIIYNDKSLDYKTQKLKTDVIRKKIEKIDFAYLHGPHGCRVCGNREADLTFNPCTSTWYCENCYKFNQDFYKKNPDPEGRDWREIYP